jgi:8-oxo-dGTP pyrophosphatase MutT (NUDIX family)
MDDRFSNPWRTLKTRVVYDNPWIRVREDDVIRPDGAHGIYGVVHFKNKAIGVLPIDEEGYVYLVGQYRYTLDRYSWEIPEGGGPEGEEPLETAKRELREETGLEARAWRPLGRAHLSNSVGDEEAIIYLATDLIHGDAEPEGTEKLEQMRAKFEDALRMVLDGEITDSISVIAILRYALHHFSSELA